MDFFVMIMCFLTTCAGFSVKAPSERVVAVQGQTVVLGCEFTPDSDLSNLLINWQRPENKRVVHSYYYQQDQLTMQDMMYQSRTALFKSELIKGNASLQIDHVGFRDVGAYECTISSSKGSGKVKVQLEYGVFYTEPQMSINMNHNRVMIQFQTAGYPKPELSWVGKLGQVLKNDSIKEESSEAEGLYNITSSYTSDDPELNITFILKNQLLNQDLHRPVIITGNGRSEFESRSAVIVLAILCVLLLLLLICIFVMLRKEKCKNKCKANHKATFSSDATTETLNGKH